MDFTFRLLQRPELMSRSVDPPLGVFRKVAGELSGTQDQSEMHFFEGKPYLLPRDSNAALNFFFTSKNCNIFVSKFELNLNLNKNVVILDNFILLFQMICLHSLLL